MSKPKFTHFRIFQPLEVKRSKKPGGVATVKLLVNDACAEKFMDVMMTDNAEKLGACISFGKQGDMLT